jgi:transcriptional regulator with XRE-family HTH domain
MTFAERIIDVRKRRELSQKDFAAALGFTPQYVNDLEHGRRLGSVEFVERVCDWLECRADQRRAWHIAGAKSHGWKV